MVLAKNEGSMNSRFFQRGQPWFLAKNKGP